MKKIVIALLLVPVLASASEIRSFWANKSYYESGKRAGCMDIRQCIAQYSNISERNACIAGSVDCFDSQDKSRQPTPESLENAYKQAWGK